jgi:hypothetical protein
LASDGGGNFSTIGGNAGLEPRFNETFSAPIGSAKTSQKRAGIQKSIDL